jgi:hypothetical protein
MYTGTYHRLLISVSVAPIDTPNRHRGGRFTFSQFFDLERPFDLRYFCGIFRYRNSGAAAAERIGRRAVSNACTGKPGYKGTGYKGNLLIRVVNREPIFSYQN